MYKTWDLNLMNDLLLNYIHTLPMFVILLYVTAGAHLEELQS